MSCGFKKSLLTLSITGLLAAPAAHATNGMNMEGYGPIATGMGGASMAYENGSAAVMNNPATLALMEDGQERIEVAIGVLDPDVTSEMPAMSMSADSSGGPYIMPAFGWTKKEGQLTYGATIFAQGGMGTEYSDTSFLTMGTGEEVRSEVGVGRLSFPVAYAMDDKLSIGGTLDYVWGGMDLKMAMSGSQFTDFLSTQNTGEASGTLVSGLQSAMLGGAIDAVNSVRFDFSNSSDFTGEANGDGFAGKIGLTYKVNDKLTIGGTYHSETSMGDWTTNNATVGMNIDVDYGLLMGGPSTTMQYGEDMALTGSLSVNDFQWPSMIGIGGSYQVNDKLMLAADIKQIKWASVMDSFRMSFTAADIAANSVFAGYSMDVEMYQNWDDQTVISFGGEYELDAALTLRAGLNISSNPVPDELVNPLFPAIVENHLTGGVGYKISTNQNVDFSLTYAPSVDVTNPGTPAAGDEVAISHSQINWQLMYTHNF